MAKKLTLLERMRRNPRDDWTIADVQKLCAQHDVDIRKPTGSSHYVAASPYLRDVQTVPFKRPIKALYIKQLVSYVDAHSMKGEEDP
ncbi:MAG: HicA-related toxin-antitoxin protein [Gymnodinialimonas sp.]